MQKIKFEIWVWKTTFFDPEKARFWYLKKTPTPPTHFVHVLSLWFSSKTIDAQMFFWSLFFLCVFKYTDQNNICTSTLHSIEKKIFFGFFSSNTKNELFCGSKKVVFKLKFQILFCLHILQCKRTLHVKFHTKINI